MELSCVLEGQEESFFAALGLESVPFADIFWARRSQSRAFFFDAAVTTNNSI